jgi:hypothetical protein
MSKFIAFGASLAVAASASAGVVYNDATFDTFDNNLANLDISSVEVTNDDTTLNIWVTTREFATWTKYMIFLNTGGPGTASNAWSRPVDLSGQTIDYFVGAWLDQPSDNTQLVGWTGSEWNWGGVQLSTSSILPNTVCFSFSLASLGLSAGDSLLFDVATSGGGNDPGVDHLSRETLATNGWGEASVAGEFLKYNVIPAPGAFALVGLAGLMGRRNRR